MFLTFWIFLTFLTFHFGAQEPGSGGPRNPGGSASQEPGGGASQEPGARTARYKPPVALEYSKNPFRPSLIGEKCPRKGQVLPRLALLPIAPKPHASQGHNFSPPVPPDQPTVRPSGQINAHSMIRLRISLLIIFLRITN